MRASSSLYLLSALLVACLLSGFASTGAIAVGLLWIWLGAVAWLGLHKPVWPKLMLMQVMLVFLLWIGASVWWSTIPYKSWYTGLILSALPLSFIAWQLTPAPDALWEIVKKALVAATWLIAAWGLYQVVVLKLPRATGPVADPNVYACLLNLAWFPLLGAFAQPLPSASASVRVRQWVLGTTLALVSLAFFAAASRAATFTWLLLMPLALWAFRRLPGFRKKALVALSLAGLGYLSITAITASDLLYRSTPQFLTQDASGSLRAVLWRTTLEMFANHPWLGTGLGTWGDYYPSYRPAEDNSTFGYYAHCDYLQIAQEGGIVTLALFLMIFFLLTRQTARTVASLKSRPEQAENLGLMLGVMAAYVHASVNFIFYLIYIDLIVGLCASRVFQSSSTPPRACLGFPNEVNPFLQRALMAVLLVVPTLQIGLHEAGDRLLNGESRSLKWLRNYFPELTPYGVARVIVAIRPQEYIARRYVLGNASQALEEVPSSDADLRTAILREVVADYDELRQDTANAPELCAAEANLLLRYHGLLPGDSAASLARSIAQSGIRSDPRHVESIIALANSYFLDEDGSDRGFDALYEGISRMIFVRDRAILQAEVLKYVIPQDRAQLGDIQQRLKDLNAGCKLGECLENSVVEQEQTARLQALIASLPRSSEHFIKSRLTE